MEDEGYSGAFYVMPIIGIVGVLGFFVVAAGAAGGDVMQANGLPTYSELEQEIERQRRIISGGIDAASAHGAERQSLRRRIELQDATINRQAAQLIELQEQLTDERMMVALLQANVAQLRTALDAVPVNSIRRYYAFTHYDVHAANDAGYTTQQFDSDDMWIGMWLESLDGDA